MNPMDIVGTAFELGVAVARAVHDAIKAGDTSTVAALRAVLKSPEHIIALDRAHEAAEDEKTRIALAERR